MTINQIIVQCKKRKISNNFVNNSFSSILSSNTISCSKCNYLAAFIAIFYSLIWKCVAVTVVNKTYFKFSSFDGMYGLCVSVYLCIVLYNIKTESSPTFISNVQENFTYS